MKYYTLILWVTQFGFSVLFPTCFFLFLAHWLMQALGLGLWIMAVLGGIGLLTSIRTARSCVHSLLRELEGERCTKEPPPAFNDHT